MNCISTCTNHFFDCFGNNLFSKTLKKSEGKKGAVVTLLASLELAKDGYVELVQNNSDELFIKSLGSIAIE